MIFERKTFFSLFFGLFFIWLAPSASAQHEIGVRFHTVNFMGDFGGGGGMGTVFLKDLNVEATTFGLSIEHKRHFAKILSWKTSVGGLKIHSNDQYTRNPFRKHRDLGMTGVLWEFTTGLEVDIFPMPYCVKRSAVTPYFGVNVGGALSMVEVIQNTLDEEKLEIESSYLVSSPTHLAAIFPMYVGIKAKFGPSWVFSSELSYRQVVGDRLDGYVRQEGDTYFSLSVGVAYNICGPSYSPIRCPRF